MVAVRFTRFNMILESRLRRVLSKFYDSTDDGQKNFSVFDLSARSHGHTRTTKYPKSKMPHYALPILPSSRADDRIDIENCLSKRNYFPAT